MSKSILISIKPKFVEKILNGEKTIEIRKTMPKCELPCKVYIYETKSKYKKGFYNNLDHKIHYCEYFGKGKVVAEFTLNDVYKIGLADTWAKYGAWLVNEERYLEDWEIEQILSGSRLSFDDMTDYLGYGDYETQQFANGYCWHIDNLKIYDKPKELSEFTHNVADYSNGVVMYSLKPEPLKRPPQSYMFVEEIKKSSN